MPKNTQDEQHPARSEQDARPGGQPGQPSSKNTTAPPNKPGEHETDAADDTAEPDGQFPSNPHGTLDDREKENPHG